MLTQNLSNQLHCAVTYLQCKNIIISKTPLCFQRSQSHWAWNTAAKCIQYTSISCSASIRAFLPGREKAIIFQNYL